MERFACDIIYFVHLLPLLMVELGVGSLIDSSSPSGATPPVNGKKDLTKDGEGSEFSDLPNERKAEEEAAPLSANTRKNRRKRRNRARRRKGGDDAAGEEKTASKTVSFGTVTVTLCERIVGGCGVPTNGTWALALGQLNGMDDPPMPLDLYESQRTDRLEARRSQLNRSDRAKTVALETRQWDMRQHPINPLFKRLTERERMSVLLPYIGEEECLSGRTIHDEFVKHAQMGSIELDLLRKQRAGSGGCECRQLMLDRVEKLPMAKLKKELNARKLSCQGGRRGLVELLSTATNGGTDICTFNCQCARNGVPCHSYLCACCRNGTVGQSIYGMCHNPAGLPCVYSENSVNNDRHRTLTEVQSK